MWRNCIISVLAALLLWACGEDAGQRAAAQLPVYTVKVASPQTGSVAEYREWVGRLEGLVSAAVLPQVSGYVAERFFTNGAFVKAGEVLYKIDSTLYEQALDEAEARLAQAAANEKEAAQHLAYNEPLAKAGAISRQSLTDAQQQLLAAQAALASAQAAVAQARTNVGYCTLKAPVDGIVGFARADVGSYVSPGGNPLVLVNSMNPIRVQFSISEQDWLNQGGSGGALHPGAEVQLLLANGEPYAYPATIEGVNNEVSATTGSLLLDARTLNPGDLLRPGMFVRVRVCSAEHQHALLVPVGAIVNIQGKSMLIEVDDKGSASLVPVSVGLQQDGMVAVTGAVSPTSRIVVSGTQQALMAVNGRAKLEF
ncbi:MAG: efflux RND transporter periplasmic adaptor subunit [Akkermansia sp.]|nr:efflux RND transporter periplasmic adaptor subunit [Akkermansia sp.]